VMSADSQPVEILEGGIRVDDSAQRRARNPIIQRTAGGFVGLVGFAGTERVEGVSTSDWLRRFDRQTPNDELESFCKRLAEALSDVWRRDGQTSVLEILVTGEIDGEVQFWFVRNSQGLRADGTHEAAADTFTGQDELNAYLKLDGVPGEGKADLVTVSASLLVLARRAHAEHTDADRRRRPRLRHWSRWSDLRVHEAQQPSKDTPDGRG
jgi:hypothetical protein